MTEDANAAKSGTKEETKRENEEDSFKVPFRLTLDKRIDLAITGVIVLFGIFLLIETAKIGTGKVVDPIGARGLPNLTGIACIIGGIILGVMRLMTWSVLPGNLVPGEGHEDEEGHPTSWVRVFSIVLVTWLSVWFLKSLGYLAVTPLFMIIAIWLMGTREWKILILFPVVYTIVSWYLFSQPLQFVLPLGFLTPFFRLLGLTP
jgi:hypothetical protein